MLLKSPTTTDKDKKALEELAKIADVDVNIYGLDMLKAGTNLDKYTFNTFRLKTDYIHVYIIRIFMNRK